MKFTDAVSTVVYKKKPIEATAVMMRVVV